MAFRIHDSVVRGEIDNRARGIVRGRLWLAGQPEPVRMELQGNAMPDLAGCLLTFVNSQPAESAAGLDSFDPMQRGCAGDLTASRRVRVPGVPLEEFLNWPKDGTRPPTHWANCLYLEWFSEANGRVVIESADYELKISEPEWRLTPDEESQRAGQAAAAMEEFMKKLTAAIEEQQRGQKDPEADWDEHDYERLLKESDARTDKFAELLDKYGDADEEKLAKEMGWSAEAGDEETAGFSVEEMNQTAEGALSEPPPVPDPAREGIDWIRTAEGEICHPLQQRCFDSAMKFWQQVDELGLDDSGDTDLEQFLGEFQSASAKLAGALNGIAENRGLEAPAFIVACLKRALHHLHQTQAGLEGVARKQLLPPPIVTEARQELFAIREGVLKLMDEFRGRK